MNFKVGDRIFVDWPNRQHRVYGRIITAFELDLACENEEEENELYVAWLDGNWGFVALSLLEQDVALNNTTIQLAED